MVVSVLTPEGVSVEVDVKKLLQDETTKRLLLEKELDAYKSTVGSLETEILQSGEESTRDRMTAKELRSSIDHMAKELDSIKVQRDALELKNRELTSQLTSSQNALAEHARAAQEWAARESALQSEIEEANS
jgi:chromosome segregation ATPase